MAKWSYQTWLPIQAAELKEIDESPEQLFELEADLEYLSDEIDNNYELHLKPELLPQKLWKFIRKEQRPHTVHDAKHPRRTSIRSSKQTQGKKQRIKH